MKKLFITTALLSASLGVAHAEELFELKDQYLSETMPKKTGEPAEMIMKNYQVGKVKVQTNLALWGKEGVYGTVRGKSDRGYFKIEPDTPLTKWRFEIDASFGFKNCNSSNLDESKTHPIHFYADNNEKFTLEIKHCTVETAKAKSKATGNNHDNPQFTVESNGSEVVVLRNSEELFKHGLGAFGKLTKIDMGVTYLDDDYTTIYNIKLTSK